MILVGAAGQRVRTTYFDASGSITSGGAAQLIVPLARQRSSFVFENISDTNMYLEFGGARATATLTTGTVSSCSVTNVGFGFSKPPTVVFLGGAGNANSTGATLPDYHAPSQPAMAHCVMSGSAPNQTVSSITMDDPGTGYVVAPYVLLINDQNDNYGCAVPSTTSGILIIPSGSFTSNGVVCVTDQIGIYCASSSKNFTFKYTV